MRALVALLHDLDRVVWPGDSRLAGSYQHNEPHQTPVLGWAFGFIHGRERFDVSPLRIITAVKSASLPGKRG